VPTPTKNTLPPPPPGATAAAVAGRTRDFNCSACSQHRNHPKWRRKATTATSSARPKGVAERHWEGRVMGRESEARTSGVLRRPSRMPAFAGAVAAVVAAAVALKADAALTRQLAATRSGRSIIVAKRQKKY